jgi:hypothetical protein
MGHAASRFLRLAAAKGGIARARANSPNLAECAAKNDKKKMAALAFEKSRNRSRRLTHLGLATCATNAGVGVPAFGNASPAAP